MRKSGWFDVEFRREQCGNTEFCDDHDGNLPGILNDAHSFECDAF